ncbi:MAG: hypothetical protein K9J13_01545 [Saprospiraceae bacterium]|nr:hypothetical protein [Saprospiraceae bacterium]
MKRNYLNIDYCFHGRIILLLILLVFGSVTRGSEKKTFLNKQAWEKSTKNINYIEDYKEIEKKESTPNINYTPPSTSGVSEIFTYIAVIIVLGFLIFFVFRLVQGGNMQMNRRIRSSKIAIESNLDEDISKVDLEYLLKKARDEKNYKLALRINFLMIVKTLSLKNLIIWRIDKTNGDYLYELADKKEWFEFAGITLTFEKVWYGDTEINEKDYSYLSKNFESFNLKLNNE